MRTENLLQQSQQLTIELQTRQTELQQTNEELASKAQAARRAERRGRAQEQGSRAGAPRARGEGGRAGAHLEVQVGVPGEHVARAAHAAQLDPDPRPAAGRERRRQPVGQAGRLRQEHPLGRHRPADADQRHPRPVEDRVGHGHRRSRGDHVQRRCATASSARSTTSPSPRTSPFHVDIDNTLPRAFTSDPKRLQQILKNLLSNAFKFTSQGQVAMRVQQVTERLVAGSSGAAVRAERGRDRGQRHRHRHRAGEAAADLRGVPAGRRRHQPQVRRHRPRPGDQPRAGDAARRRDQAGRARPGRAARSRCICRSPTPARRAPSPAAGAERPAQRRVPQHRAAGARRREGRGGRRRRSRGHRARATTCCSSSTTIRTTRACCSGWRATRASRASSPTAARRR